MRARHQDIEQTARKFAGGNVTSSDAATEMRALLDRLMRPSDAARGARRQQAQCKVFAELHNSATATQRQKLAATLRAYAGDAQAMSLNPATLVGSAEP
jgi:hypothetical protein